uniref:Uncharacterized protein n=1 Tax=Anguilla anguilla TaxID=7936 RepID=A0A0E9Q066_ANGAN
MRGANALERSWKASKLPKQSRQMNSG